MHLVRTPDATSLTSNVATATKPRQESATHPTVRTKSAYRRLLVLVFVAALAIRISHVLPIEHRIWCSGDAYNYLVTGHGLLRAATDSSARDAFIKSLDEAKSAPGPLPESQKLVDRLQIDGPVYPTYLAAALWVSGASKDSFDQAKVGVTLCNAVVDSVSCVLLAAAATLLFNPTIGIFSGVLLALYPGAVINTQQCLSEPFAMFLTIAWLLCAFSSILKPNTGIRTLATNFLLGITTGALFLAKSANILLVPLLVITAAIALSRPKRTNRSNLARVLIPALTGLCLTLLPWLLFNHQVTGNWSLVIDRVPGCNLLYANSIRSDGWETFPDATPWATSFIDNVTMLQRTFAEDPAAFMSLQIRKVARMFGSVWNEFAYPILGIGYNEQTIAHRLLLLFSLAGFLRLLMSAASAPAHQQPTDEPEIKRLACAALLFAVIAFHLIYVPFEAMPRYVLPAMPAVILFAAFGVAEAFASSKRSQLVQLVLAATSISALCLTPAICTGTAALLPGLTWLGPWVSATFAATCVILSIKSGLSAVTNNEQAKRKHWKMVSLAMAAVVTISTFVAVVSKKSWTEWQTTLTGADDVLQSLTLPKLSPRQFAGTSFIIMDITSEELAPQVSVEVNCHKSAEPPIPFAALLRNNKDILNGLFTWQAASGRESRSFRQWWCVPIKTEWLHFGQSNDIIVRASGGAPITLFGDFPREGGPDKNNYLPSFFTFSHNGGYASIQRGDARVMERFHNLENAESTGPHGVELAPGDLSPSAGIQTGVYRIRVACLKNTGPGLANGAASTSESSLDSKPLTQISLCGSQPHTVTGNDPASMFPSHSTATLPPNLRTGTRFQVSAELQNRGSSQSAYLNVLFRSSQNPKSEWHAFWQPAQVDLDNKWQSLTFCDVIPDNLIDSKDISVRLVVSPYQPELIYTNRKKALHSKVLVRNVQLTLRPPLDPHVYESSPSSWSVF